MRKLRGKYTILRFLIYGITLLIGFIMSILAIAYIESYMNLYYVSKQLKSNFDPESVSQTFRSHFSSGMTRQEASDILLEIDPSLEEQLQHQHIRCVEGGDRCSETLCLFHERVNCQFTYTFIYSLDLRLMHITYD